MKKTERTIFRHESGVKEVFEEECKKVDLTPSEVLRELVNRFNQEGKLRNSIRVKVELDKKKQLNKAK